MLISLFLKKGQLNHKLCLHNDYMQMNHLPTDNGVKRHLLGVLGERLQYIRLLCMYFVIYLLAYKQIINISERVFCNFLSK